MHDVCTEQHVGNAKCASPLSRSLLRALFVTTLGLLRHGRAGRNINDQANHPERTSGRGARDACNCAASRPSVASGGRGGLVLAMAWRMRARDSTHSTTGKKGKGGTTRWSRQGHDGLSEYGLTMFVDGPWAHYQRPLRAPAVRKLRSVGSSGFWCLPKNNISFASKFVSRL